MQKAKSNYFRLSKNTKEHYTSLETLRKAWGIKPFSKRTNDLQKLEAQQTKFLGKCSVCGMPLVYVRDTNVLSCTNEQCKGLESTGKDGTKTYEPVNRLLDNVGADIAQTLFE